MYTHKHVYTHAHNFLIVPSVVRLSFVVFSPQSTTLTMICQEIPVLSMWKCIVAITLYSVAPASAYIAKLWKYSTTQAQTHETIVFILSCNSKHMGLSKYHNLLSIHSTLLQIVNSRYHYLIRKGNVCFSIPRISTMQTLVGEKFQEAMVSTVISFTVTSQYFLLEREGPLSHWCESHTHTHAVHFYISEKTTDFNESFPYWDTVLMST